MKRRAISFSLKISANGHIWVGIQYGGLMELDSNLRPVRSYLQNLSIADILFEQAGRRLGNFIGTGRFPL